MTIKAEVKTMALKNLFDMVKADRYTQDGREALIKAQEEETEDKVYQIGEISQKTGLQKTANGWVKPKSGKQPGAKTGEGKSEPKNVHGAEVDKIYERQLKRIKELKAKGFTDEQIDNDKIIKQTKEDMRNVGKKPESKPDTAKEIAEHREAAQYYKRKARSFSETDPSYSTYMKKAEEFENKVKELEGSQPTENIHKLSNSEHNARIKAGITASGIDTGSRYKNENGAKIDVNSIGDDGTVNYSVRNPDGSRQTHEARSREELERILSVNGYSAADAAPKIRELTGDCRIRIRKEKPALTGDTKIRVRK